MSDGIPAAHTETSGNVLEPALKKMHGADSLRERRIRMRIGIPAIEQTIQRRPENLLPILVSGNLDGCRFHLRIGDEGGAEIADGGRRRNLRTSPPCLPGPPWRSGAGLLVCYPGF